MAEKSQNLSTTKHSVPERFINPIDPITICIVGCGGTGSKVAMNLAYINHSLISMGHPGLNVKIVDPDKVSEANIGRQLFTTGEIGIHKSIAIANRINRTFGFRWQGYPMKWTKKCTANITITCVDSVKTRVYIHKHLVNNKSNAEKFGFTFASRSFYWIDTGNDYDFGQIILGTTRRWKQLTKRSSYIPNVFDLHPEFKDAKSDSRPSCSIAMALSKQDLFINTMIADYTGQMVWKMLTKPFIDYHAVYLNLATMKVNTRKI